MRGTGVTVGVSIRVKNGHRQKVVVVQYPTETLPDGSTFRPSIPYDELADKLPAKTTGIAGAGTAVEQQVDDIPVILERVERDHHCDCPYTCDDYRYYDFKYRPIPAGARWETENDNGCTTGTPVYDNGVSEYRIVTASHCFYETKSYEFHQHDPDVLNSYVGYRVDEKIDFRHDPLFDAAVVDIFQYNVNLTHRFATDSGGYRGSIDGSMTETRLRDLEGTSTMIKMQGSRLGINAGTVEHVTSSSFQTTAKTCKGDSGGPHYEKYWDQYFNRYRYTIAGVHRGTNNGNAQGTQIENVEDRWNVEV